MLDSKDVIYCYFRCVFCWDFYFYGIMLLIDDSGDFNGDKLLVEDLVYVDIFDKGIEKKN